MNQPAAFPSDPLEAFHPPVREWFESVFPAPTLPQQLGWPVIARGDSTLILAATGTGKTLTAFLWCIDRLMFTPPPPAAERCRVLYISPIKALAVDVERNLRAPLAGVAQIARKQGVEFHEPSIFIRTGDTAAVERSRFARKPADILITTPESIYLMLTSNARESLRSVRDGDPRRDPRAGSQQARRRTWRSRSNGWSSSAAASCSASVFRPPSGPWKKWRAFWAEPKVTTPPGTRPPPILPKSPSTRSAFHEPRLPPRHHRRCQRSQEARSVASRCRSTT